MLYGTITEFCTEKTCPVMNAGAKFEYLWADNNSKKPIKCSAPAYVDYLMSWVQDQIDDDSIFPSKIGVPFPKNFQETAKETSKKTYHQGLKDQELQYTRVWRLAPRKELMRPTNSNAVRVGKT